MAYKETYLYSAKPNQINANAMTAQPLYDLPTNYDKIRVTFTNYNNTTGGPDSWGACVPFTCYEYDPSKFSVVGFEGVMWGGLTTATGGNLKRSCALRTNVNTKNWAMTFNTTADNTSKTVTNSNWQNTVESVIGIKYNAQDVSPTKREILYEGDGGELTGKHSFTLNKNPLDYDRIGIISNIKEGRYTAYPTQYPIQRYAEYPSWYLSGENCVFSNNDLMEGGVYGTLCRCIGIYSGCSGTEWYQVSSFRGNGQTVNTTTVDQQTSCIVKVIGIKL